MKKRRSFLHRLLRGLSYMLGFMMLLFMALLSPVDRQPLEETDFYREALRLVAESAIYSGGEGLEAAWGQISMTSEEPVALLGYRPRGPYTFVADSTYLRGLLFREGSQEVLWLNFELMLVHPHLAEKVAEQVRVDHPDLMLFFSATHTHSGAGGTVPGLAGRFAFGGYDPAFVAFLQAQSQQLYRQLREQLAPYTLAYGQKALPDFVVNRVFPEAEVDPMLRQVQLRQEADTLDLLFFQAHPTLLPAKYMGLSGDYPALLLQDLAAQRTGRQAIFLAGPVGSHGAGVGERSREAMEGYARALSQAVAELPVQEIESEALRVLDFPLPLRAPQYRIHRHVSLRPWVFRWLFGDVGARVQAFRKGDWLHVSLPAEVSGMLMPAWERYAEERGLLLTLSCFNGGYTGYVTVDAWYDLPVYEARDMSWFGPDQAAYLDAVMRALIERMALLE
ncbi:hypothetical protein A3SI_01856 [Nitritalea halalkaliphila LW7]|uniref:Neutral/alkaline non-lysosomal ceramidase N-terminal domain-containing protein n=1 Tax=Nitritalea halalkaliphila LW7 TaxID=1189621 RepID=I5CAB3_9BACT|nr:hypothetical protein [Nitritalea halalkaliphila]EIM78765.1 hypothetical protein A3SI_01856 [Nitritalea halalkaliphila LW7]